MTNKITEVPISGEKKTTKVSRGNTKIENALPVLQKDMQNYLAGKKIGIDTTLFNKLLMQLKYATGIFEDFKKNLNGVVDATLFIFGTIDGNVYLALARNDNDSFKYGVKSVRLALSKFQLWYETDELMSLSIPCKIDEKDLDVMTGIWFDVVSGKVSLVIHCLTHPEINEMR